jgi:ArsR family transcriptional regulator
MLEETAYFKVLADQTRLRLIVILSLKGETCVCKLAQALEAPESRISRHLGIMRMAGIVEARREGTWVHYKLSQNRNRLEVCLQACFRECFADHPTVKADIERLAQVTC